MYPDSSFLNYTADLIKSPVGNIIVGFIFLFVSGVFDIADSFFLNWGLVATRYSFFIFTLGTSLILARDFGRLHNNLAKAIQELEWANVNLETKVYNRTKELEIQTQKAEAASRSKSEFLARVSHEIRTPLNAIIGLSEIELQKRIDAPETEENLGTIYNSGSMLLAIINEILDISKMEAGRFQLTVAEYGIDSLIADSVNLNLYRIGSKPLVFELNADEDLPSRLFGDELRVKQVLNNLLSNAFKYTNEGKVGLSISCERQYQKNKVTLRFSVSDSGVGIKAEDIGRLFDDYSQFDYRSSRPVEGSGLGLPIARGLARMMDGNIIVESEFGKGSVFTAIIIQEAAGDSTIGKAASENLKAIRFSRSFHTKNEGLIRKPMPYGRVLVVDDFKSNLAVARGLLAPYQITTDCVSSGEEAIEKVNAVEAGRLPKYDLILMDHMMPGMDGVEAVRIIRELDSDFARTVPIIALTAKSAAGIEDLFLSKGFSGFIAKPMDLWLFDGILNQWIRDKHKNPPVQEGFQIEGIDLAKGFERYGGKEAFLEIVKVFCDQGESILTMLGNPREETLGDYAITAHGLKGSLFGICADELGREAELLEKAAKAGDLGTVLAGNPAFLQRLAGFVLGLKALDIPKETKGRKAEPDRELLSELLKAAEEFDLNKMEDRIAALEDYEYDKGGEIVPWLREKIRNLEYGEIIAKLK
jgi:signal transduction histidine kinase